MAAIRRAVEGGRDASVARLQAWIRNPTVTAEKFRIDEGVAHMSILVREADLLKVLAIPIGGVPAVFATLDIGAPKRMGVFIPVPAMR